MVIKTLGGCCVIHNQKMHEPLPALFANVPTSFADRKKTIGKKIAAKPFVKWVGGKRSILPKLMAHVPEDYTTYHEPFFGGGALFFELQPENAVLSDINSRLMNAYRVVRDAPEPLLELLAEHKESHNKSHYLECRDRLSAEMDEVKLAALFIYINKTCYNGLYRVNKAGKYNVPMGSYKNPSIFDEDNLRGVSDLLQRVEIKQRSFEQVEIQKGDFFYFDPPYHKTYDKYSNDRFADEKHEKLADLCCQIDKKRAYFMLSNSDTDFVRELYEDFKIGDVMASRNVSCKAAQRGRQNELLIRNYD